MNLVIPGYQEGRDYTEKPESPSITRDRITRTFYARKSIAESLFRAILSAQGQQDSGMALDASQCSMTSGIYATITLVFTSTAMPYSVGSASNPSYVVDTVGSEHRIEELSGYRYCWNHNLYYLCPDGSTPPDPPAFFLTATDGSDADGQWQWGDDTRPQSNAEGFTWREVGHRTKKADIFLYPETCIHETKTYRSRSEAQAAALRVGQLKAPPKTFGLPSTDSLWLVTKSSVSDSDNTLNTDYQYSPTGWDPDFYGEAN